MARLLLRSIFVFIFVISLTRTHESASFPGTGNHQDPHNQHPPPPEVHQAQFGGEQTKDEAHIKQHLEGKINPTQQMSPEQMQYHYFNMYDLNKDQKLDGTELIKAINHFHEENPGPQHKDTHVPPPLPSEVELLHMVQSILQEDDFDGDGQISYAEFVSAQKRRDAQMHQQPPPPPPR